MRPAGRALSPHPAGRAGQGSEAKRREARGDAHGYNEYWEKVCAAAACRPSMGHARAPGHRRSKRKRKRKRKRSEHPIHVDVSAECGDEENDEEKAVRRARMRNRMGGEWQVERGRYRSVERKEGQ